MKDTDVTGGMVSRLNHVLTDRPSMYSDGKATIAAAFNAVVTDDAPITDAKLLAMGYLRRDRFQCYRRDPVRVWFDDDGVHVYLYGIKLETRTIGQLHALHGALGIQNVEVQ